HFIKKAQAHKEGFGVHPVRAVLVETTDEARGKKLMELAGHPLVCGSAKRTGLFWFTISPLFTEPTENSGMATYLDRPATVLDRIWALPHGSMHALGDVDNSASTAPK